VAGEELPEAAAAPKAQARAMVRIIAGVRMSLFVVREQRPLQRSASATGELSFALRCADREFATKRGPGANKS